VIKLNLPSVKILLFIPAVLLLFAIVSLLIPGSAIEAFSSQIAPKGSIIVFVEDGNAKEPIPDACVTIPETGQSFHTDKNGKTETIQVPILEDSSYKGILPKPWGEITLLVYKEGYVDCAIFHVNIWENQTRSGPTVLLFPVTPDIGSQPFTLTEAPNRLWVNELLNRFKPDDVH
jgi:hypothetical protein